VTATGAGDLRARFRQRLGFRLDPFQERAIDALDSGGSVLVSAPTGSGKTVVADYGVARAIESGKRAFYTTPLKALSNQKLGELAETYGDDKVGLLTGDVSHLPDAPVVVMTTEVLRNMLFSAPQGLHDLGLVVLDEVHFLQDPYRGSVWEEVLIVCPPGVVFVCLSATVSNAVELGAWMRQVRGPTEVVVETRRPVELRNHLAVTDRGSRQVHLVPLLWKQQLHRDALALDRRFNEKRGGSPYRHRRPGRDAGDRHSGLATPRRTELVEALAERSMLPAIVFIFSRAACDDAVAQCLRDGLRLTEPEQRIEIRRLCEEHTEGISDEELRALDYGPWSAALEAGVAAHHAGMVPAFREAVEECFESGLLSLVYATETLALGINMPARTVVIERLTKVREHGRSSLTSGEYAQLSGRAGRRGLDDLGHTVVVWSPRVLASDLARLATSPAPELRSSFRPTYNLAVNLVRRFRSDSARQVLDKSFAQFQDSRHSDALSARLERILEVLDRRGHVDVANWHLTESGKLLARIYHDCDLLVAEALDRGLLDGLEAPKLAATVSAFTYEARAGRWHPEPRLPSVVLDRIHSLVSAADALRDVESEMRISKSRRPEPGFAEAALRWASGDRLELVLERGALSPGDFVRNAKQLADLLRQLAVAAPVSETARTAREAADSIQRGVVSAGWVGALADADSLLSDAQLADVPLADSPLGDPSQ
jgi:ATP-dependent RNA helicase HelY